MVAVVHPLQFGKAFLMGEAKLLPDYIDIRGETVLQLLLAYAANAGILIVQGDVRQLVQVAEYRDLAELRHPSEHVELKELVAVLERGEERLVQRPVRFLLSGVCRHVLEERVVIFIDKDDDSFPRFFCCVLQCLCEAYRKRRLLMRQAVGVLKVVQRRPELGGKALFLREIAACERKIHDRIFRPGLLFLAFKFLDRKPPEQVPAALKIIPERGKQEALAEAPGAA